MFTVFLMAFALILPHSVSAATPPAYEFVWNENDERLIGGPALIKNGVTFVPMELVTKTAGLDLSWDATGKRAQFSGWQKSFAVRIGSLTGVLDGKSVKLEGAPFILRNELYLPARFVVQALNGKNLAWDAKTKTIKAGHLQSFKQYAAVHEKRSYTVVGKTGTLYVTDSKGTQHELAKLGAPIKEHISFRFEKTAGGLLLLSLSDHFGSGVLFSQQFTLVIKDGAVLQQASVLYSNRMVTNATQGNGQLLLNEGKTLRVLEDGTGKVLETINLEELGGGKDHYYVEYFAKDVLLLRASQKGILMLVDRESGNSTFLYKTFFDMKQQELVEKNQASFPGDFLKFVQREGNTLYFKNEDPTANDQTSYSINIVR